MTNGPVWVEYLASDINATIKDYAVSLPFRICTRDPYSLNPGYEIRSRRYAISQFQVDSGRERFPVSRSAIRLFLGYEHLHMMTF